VLFSPDTFHRAPSNAFLVIRVEASCKTDSKSGKFPKWKVFRRRFVARVDDDSINGNNPDDFLLIPNLLTDILLLTGFR
jgi:hypothetical protein